LLGTEALAIKKALIHIKLNAKGSEEEREKARLSAVVVGDISCSIKEKRIVTSVVVQMPHTSFFSR